MGRYNYNSGMYGGMGYGGGYGGGMGYGGGYGGGMGYGNNYMGGPGDPNDQSLARRMESGTAATFQIIESIVGAFGGFAQMLESTFMATHSSFFAMVSVAEQFGNLRNTLGSVLGIFAVIRWIKYIFAKLTGRPVPNGIDPSGFAKFEQKWDQGLVGPSSGPKPSKKPLFFFMLAVFGLPYLMSRLIKSLSEKLTAEEEDRRRMMAEHGGVPGFPMGPEQDPAMNPDGPLDPSKLEFCRATFDFEPSTPNVELPLCKGDIVAVLSKTDPFGNPSQWWRGRLRDGRTGYFPSNYCEIIERRKQITELDEAAASGKATPKPAFDVAEFQQKQNIDKVKG